MEEMTKYNNCGIVQASIPNPSNEENASELQVPGLLCKHEHVILTICVPLCHNFSINTCIVCVCPSAGIAPTLLNGV